MEQVSPVIENFEATLPQAMKVALAHQQAGRLREAAGLYRQVLQIDPRHADALHFLGLIAHLLERHQEAIDLISRALKITPIAAMHANLAQVQNTLGQHEAALESYQQAIVMNPKFVLAYVNRAGILLAQGRLQEAIAHYQQALALDPEFAEAHNNLGTALQASGQMEAARMHYDRAIALKADYADAYGNLAALYEEQGQLSLANQVCRQALALRPDHVGGHCTLGNILQAQGQLHAAIDSYRHALTLNPEYAEAHNNLGTVLQRVGNLKAAIQHYNKAIALKPEYSDAYNNLAAVLEEQGQLELAKQACRQGLALKPDNAQGHGNLGNILQAQGHWQSALESYQKALELKPDHLTAHDNLLFALSYAPPALYPPDVYLTHARRYGACAMRHVTPYAAWQTRPFGEVGATQRPLRLGIVSGDLRGHPVGYFLQGVLTALDPARVELFAYPSNPQQEPGDALTQRIKSLCTRWHGICGLSDQQAASVIHGDAVDILLDLAGHTAHNRLPLFGWKAAPVQVAWLGYWASTGMPGVDYLLADPVSVPREHQAHFSEKIWYLPDFRLCFTPPENAEQFPCGALPASVNGHLTFGCLQSLFKINDAVLDIWGRIFAALPDARLYLQNKQMNCMSTRSQLLQRLQRVGIASERVTVMGAMPRADYLASYAKIDIVLDTFPYTGGTTTCEALWMGVPTLTIQGGSMVARQGEALLRAAGLPEWVAADAQDYVARARNAAGQLEHLARLRSGLRARVLASALFDCARFARNLEQALVGMYRVWQNPQLAESQSFQSQHTEVDRLCTAGQALRARKEPAKAVECYRQALALDPTSLKAWNCLGNALRDMGQHEEAAQSYLNALKIEPHLPIVINNLANAISDKGSLEEAVPYFHRAIALAPDLFDAHFDLGVTLQKQGAWVQAEESYRNALRLKPDSVKTLRNLGIVYQGIERLPDAVASFRKVLELEPESADIWNDLAVLLVAMGHAQEAINCYQKAVSLKPDDRRIRYHRALAALSVGDFVSGLLDYEYRWDDSPSSRTKRRTPVPPWLGETSLQGKTILLHAEQGLGDTLQMLRYIPLIAQSGACIQLEVQPALKHFVSYQFDVAGIYTTGDELPAVDCHCPLMSLPLAFGASLANIPSSQKYLRARADLVEKLAQEIGTLETMRIGICWQGEVRHKMDKQRSPGFAPFKRLFQVPGAKFFTLMKDSRAMFLAESGGSGFDLRREIDATTEPFEETAALMMNLDLIISSDTSIAHLACALGRPTWIVLPYVAEWRWLRDRTDSPWYPTAKLFRQTSPGDWSGVFHRVADALPCPQ